MRFGVLGPLAVTTDAGDAVTVPGAKVRALLADLLAHRNQVVSADRLIDDLWGDDPPANAAGALQVRVSQLRKALNDAEPGARDLVESRPPGYVLRTARVDADRFAELAAEPDVDSLAEALGLWRGEPYADVADEEYVRAEAARLAEARLVVLEKLADARLARGEHALVAADLAELVARHPLREGLRALHLRALYAAGRQTEALDSYADLRDRLADELGLDPGPELVALHRQILAQDTTLSAPPKAALIRNSLPAQVDELVGRAEALAELRGVVPGQRLVTLIGPGGVGKTRLATEAAREQDFPDGARLVELTALRPGETAVAELVLAALDVREVPGASVAAEDRLVAAVRHRRVLLVLDNCEHVVEPVAALVARLLREAPGVTVLATSREPLGLAGELLWEVPPLPVPADGGDVDAVRRSAAARLFAARAAAQQRGFRLDERTAPAVAQLCRRLDGLPLALELAATRVRSLGLAGVVDRLDDRFRLLSTAQRDVPARQRTLTAVIGWSWDLLDDHERAVLARLAVPADGCTLAAAEAVCGADLDVLARLVDRSLVVVDESGAEPRYRLLESVAAFCLDRLDDAGAVRARHVSYYTELAERADPLLRGPGQREWLARLDAESANLRAALAHGGSLRLANALTWYWYLRGRYTEARRALAGASGDADDRARAAVWRAGFALLQGDPVAPGEIEAALAGYAEPRAVWFVAAGLLDVSDLTGAAALLDRALAAGDDPWTAAAVAVSRALIAHAAGDPAELRRHAEDAAARFAELGDDWGRLQASDWLGGLAEMTGRYDEATALHAEGLRWAEELTLWPAVGGKLSWLAWIAVQTGDYARARELAGRAYRLAEEQDSSGALVFAELGLGFAARRDGKLDIAVQHLQRLADRAGEDELHLPMVLSELGYAAADAGDPARALALHARAFDRAVAIGAPRDTVGALEGMAAAAPSPETAARLLGAAHAARAAGEVPAAPAERDGVERATERLVAALGAERFAAAFAAGNGLSPGEARALVG
ncbi:BTAD domain-containing putative transcriptional regulator [Spirilliplanes yamanashiensis]|uniref:SARP family transcriptional regulator n=1 Tax=Spirilliplanes yamanashiensis TaxID=42233 RepID=A0A8J3YD43_9ACTN|nr:BTAD domain-containing putative transcriptional regulator [Spirilliplanes yamanashiensis]MDP9815216.1 putative ATPase/DNA-binding SARP family transcriptional activator [Spirilliplanes yamanashiensis]GIJ06516.1 SARP family transcriptional regulator [Spirilliplanes yamanashiensis]